MLLVGLNFRSSVRNMLVCKRRRPLIARLLLGIFSSLFLAADPVFGDTKEFLIEPYLQLGTDDQSQSLILVWATPHKENNSHKWSVETRLPVAKSWQTM